MAPDPTHRLVPCQLERDVAWSWSRNLPVNERDSGLGMAEEEQYAVKTDKGSGIVAGVVAAEDSCGWANELRSGRNGSLIDPATGVHMYPPRSY